MGIGKFHNYPWASDEFGISVGVFFVEVMKMLPRYLLSYIGIATLATMLGAMFHKLQAVLTLMTLSLIISYISLPAFRINLLPFANIVSKANSNLIALGNSITTMSVPGVPLEISLSVLVTGVAVITGAVFFSKKAW